MVFEELLSPLVDTALNIRFVAVAKREFLRPICQFDRTTQLVSDGIEKRRSTGIAWRVVAEPRDEDADLQRRTQGECRGGCSISDSGQKESRRSAAKPARPSSKPNALHSTMRSPEGCIDLIGGTEAHDPARMQPRISLSLNPGYIAADAVLHRPTIFALSSGRPPAAIAVVRISGPRAGDALKALTGRMPAPRQAALRPRARSRNAASRSTRRWRCGFRRRTARPARTWPSCNCTAAAR